MQWDNQDLWNRDSSCRWKIVGDKIKNLQFWQVCPIYRYDSSIKESKKGLARGVAEDIVETIVSEERSSEDSSIMYNGHNKYVYN